MRGVRRVMRPGVAGIGRVDRDRDGERAKKAGDDARPSAQNTMICCQLCLPIRLLWPDILMKGYAPHCELPLNVAAAMPPLFRNRIASCR